MGVSWRSPEWRPGYVPWRIGSRWRAAIGELIVRRQNMPDPLLTFELNKERDVLVIHGDAAGLRYLARVVSRLADHADSGRSEHDHLMTAEWAGHELSSRLRDPKALLLNKVTIRGWPKDLRV